MRDAAVPPRISRPSPVDVFNTAYHAVSPAVVDREMQNEAFGMVSGTPDN